MGPSGPPLGSVQGRQNQDIWSQQMELLQSLAIDSCDRVLVARGWEQDAEGGAVEEEDGVEVCASREWTGVVMMTCRGWQRKCLHIPWHVGFENPLYGAGGISVLRV